METVNLKLFYKVLYSFTEKKGDWQVQKIVLIFTMFFWRPTERETKKEPDNKNIYLCFQIQFFSA